MSKFDDKFRHSGIWSHPIQTQTNLVILLPIAMLTNAPGPQNRTPYIPLSQNLTGEGWQAPERRRGVKSVRERKWEGPPVSGGREGGTQRKSGQGVFQ